MAELLSRSKTFQALVGATTKTEAKRRAQYVFEDVMENRTVPYPRVQIYFNTLRRTKFSTTQYSGEGSLNLAFEFSTPPEVEQYDLKNRYAWFITEVLTIISEMEEVIISREGSELSNETYLEALDFESQVGPMRLREDDIVQQDPTSGLRTPEVFGWLWEVRF